MSINAVSWALGLKVDRSSTKFVLVALCNYANEFGECYPSAKQLAEDTCQDIKTVESNLARLRDSGLIVDTGMRRGSTKQVIVYRIVPDAAAPKEAPKPAETPPKTGQLNTPVFPANTPVFPLNTPVFPEKHPQKRGTEPSRNRQGTVKKEVKRENAPAFCLPDWINKSHWDAWHSTAKRKNASPAQKQMAVDKLAAWRAEGIDHAAALENAALAGWQGLFKPDDPASAMTPGRRSNGTPNKHAAAAAAIWGAPAPHSESEVIDV